MNPSEGFNYINLANRSAPGGISSAASIVRSDFDEGVTLFDMSGLQAALDVYCVLAFNNPLCKVTLVASACASAASHDKPSNQHDNDNPRNTRLLAATGRTGPHPGLGVSGLGAEERGRDNCDVVSAAVGLSSCGHHGGVGEFRAGAVGEPSEVSDVAAVHCGGESDL